MKRQTYMTVACVCVAAAGLVSAVAAFMLSDASLRTFRRGSPLRIGYAVEPPYAFLTAEGEVTGESPEIAKRITARLGIHALVWRKVGFSALIDELEAGNIDVIAAGLFVTPERAKRVAFSSVTCHAHSALLVAAGNPKRLRSCRQAAADSAVRIAVLKESVEERRFRDLGTPDGRLMIVPNALTGLAAVESHLADALALSSPTVAWMVSRGRVQNVEAAAPFEAAGEADTGCGAFAFRKRDRALLRAWNRELDRFLGSAEHLALATRFGFATNDVAACTATTKGKARTHE